jgi:hypothetical protein
MRNATSTDSEVAHFSMTWTSDFSPMTVLARVMLLPSRNLNPIKADYALVPAENEFVPLRT